MWLAAGALVGVLIVLIARQWRPPEPAPAGGSPFVVESTDSPAAPPESAELIQQLETIPFPQLHGDLENFSPSQMNEIAEQLRQLAENDPNDAKIKAFFKAWAHLDAKAAFAAAASLGTTGQRAVALGDVVDEADAPLSPALATMLKDLSADALSRDDRNSLFNSAATRWSETDPMAAAKFIDTLPADRFTLITAYGTIAERWAQTDPAAAMAWQQSHLDSGRVATSGTLSGWWQRDPAAAEAYVAAHPDGFTGRSNVAIMAEMIWDKDPQHAQAWVNQLPDPESRRNAESMIASKMAMSDPRAAADWALALPDDLGATALGNAISIWAISDRNAATDYISHLDGQMHDVGLAGLADRVAMGYSGTGGDPQTAANLAASIADPTIQERSLESVVKMWLNENSAAATQWSKAADCRRSRSSDCLPCRREDKNEQLLHRRARLVRCCRHC